jgi:hypothetical protein
VDVKKKKRKRKKRKEKKEKIIIEKEMCDCVLFFMYVIE